MFKLNKIRLLLFVLILLISSVSFAAVSHVKVFVQQSVSSVSSTGTFTTSATNTNDAVCIQVAAAASTLPTSATLTASGWSFTQISSFTTWPAVASAASFCAIAPNTNSVTFTATFSGGVSFTAISIIGDEFSGNDITGGTTTFEATNSATATSGSPTLNITPVNNNDALWGAVQDTTSAVGSGYTKGADDTQGDWTEWKILVNNGGVSQVVNFTGGPGYILQAVAIKALSPGYNITIKGNVKLKGNVKVK
jgi:hypothetical protein